MRSIECNLPPFQQRSCCYPALLMFQTLGFTKCTKCYDSMIVTVTGMLGSLVVIPLQCRSCSHLSHLSYRLARILALHLFQLHLLCLFCSPLCFKHILLWWRWQFFSRPLNPFIVSFISLICGINFDYFQNSCLSLLLSSCDPIAFWLLLSSWLFFNKQFVNFLNIYWGKKNKEIRQRMFPASKGPTV